MADKGSRQRREDPRQQREVLEVPEVSPDGRHFLDSASRSVRPLHHPDPPRDERWAEDRLGFPGELPFTRGVQPTMYRGRLWTMRQYSGFGDAATTNARYRYLLDAGQTGLSVAFDLPTQMGYDSDHELATGEVGKVGVAISSIEDLRTLFARIPLDQVSTSMTINAPAGVLLAMYLRLAREQGADLTRLAGTVQNDILKEYVARGTFIFPPAASLRLVVDSFAWCAEHVPRWNSISVSGYHIREAGSTAAEELGFTIANGLAYLAAARERGLDPERFAPRISFFWNAHNGLFEEVAKFRAARRLWSDLLLERFAISAPKARRMRFHTQTGGSTLTAQDPENNVVRVTIQALAAVLGGTQSLHTNSLDEALGLPTERSARIALRTQQVIAHESGVANSIDPLAGSYHVEDLTDGLEEEAMRLIAEVDERGGMVRAIESGWVGGRIADSAYRYQREVDAGARRVIGVNLHAPEGDRSDEVLAIDPALEQGQVERLRIYRDGRNRTRLEAALADLQSLADGPVAETNLMEGIVVAVEADATLGEVCDALAEVFGRYRAPGTL